MIEAARPPFDLILITEPELADPVGFVRECLERVEPGRVAVQLRAKQWNREQRRDAAIAIAALAQQSGSHLIINGDAELCVEVCAHGVQLPAQGPSIPSTRAVIGSQRWIGSSCHSRDEIERAQRQGADFALLSPWNDVPNKAVALGREGFISASAGVALPIYALGGLGVANIEAVIGAGACGVAVIREAHAAKDRARWVVDTCKAIASARTRPDID